MTIIIAISNTSNKTRDSGNRNEKLSIHCIPEKFRLISHSHPYLTAFQVLIQHIESIRVLMPSILKRPLLRIEV